MATKQFEALAPVSAEEYERFLSQKSVEIQQRTGMFGRLKRRTCNLSDKHVGGYMRAVNNWLFPLSLTSLLVFWLVPTILLYFSSGNSINDPVHRFVIALTQNSSKWIIRFYVYTLYTLLWIGFVTAVRVLLASLLRYHSFLYERKTLSNRTKLWACIVKILTSYLGGRRTLYSYQRLLPYLPVPPLKSTISRYLQSMRPLLDDAAYQRLCIQSEQFLNGEGKRFQRYLWLKWLTSPNYVTDWWERYAYLHSRAPLLVNSNYYVMDNHGLNLVRRPASRAANLTHCMLKFRDVVLRQELKPLTVAEVVPLCSWQHERNFDTTRIPGVDDDVLEHAKVPATHIAVFHRGRWFKLETHYRGELLPAVELEVQFEAILADTSQPYPGEERLAALTAGERNHWAKTRARYFPQTGNDVNGNSLRVIETAAFVVALDDDVAFEFDEKDPTQFDQFAWWLLCGNGTNRWCDKNYTLIVMGNGRAGLNVEHSWSDGLISAVLWEYALFEDLGELGYTADGRCRGEKRVGWEDAARMPARLTWSLDNEHAQTGSVSESDKFVKVTDTFEDASVMQCIDQAYGVARGLIDDTELVILNFTEYGKGFIKTCKVSPDGFVQLVLQLAYFRDQGHFDLTYETSMTRLYLHGRTETVRPCTMQSTAFVRSMQSDAKCTNAKRRELLRDACYAHQRQYLDCMNGKGIDRHLFALYIVSKGVSKDVPSPFLESYIKDSSWKLSTSQTPRGLTDRVDENNPLHLSAGGGFGPVTPDGYGISYVLAGEGIVFFHISSRKSCTTTDSNKFREQIRLAMRDMKSIYTQPSDAIVF